jgi:Rod binding domain-containing protein
MTGSSTAFSSGISTTATLPTVPSGGQLKTAKAAREFEAQLIGMVLESMEKTFAALPGQSTSAGEDDYNYLGTQALASTVAAGGGFGIARLICRHLEARR